MLLLTAIAPFGLGCSETPDKGFQKELQLAQRAGRGELSDEEKKELLKKNHPLLLQLGQPQGVTVLEMFAKLTPAQLDLLMHDTYLKWQFRDLDKDSQEAYRSIIRSNLAAARRPGSNSDDEYLAMLEDVELGYALIDVPEKEQRVISMFMLWPNVPAPAWVTVVNTGASGTNEYVKAHFDRLAMLRSMSPNQKSVVVHPIERPQSIRQIKRICSSDCLSIHIPKPRA